MNKFKKEIAIAAILAIIIAALFFFRQTDSPESESITPSVESESMVFPAPVTELEPPAQEAAPKPVSKKPPVAHKEPEPPSRPMGPSDPIRPKVEVFPELIPKDIHIVRVYYTNMIVAPGDSIEFDINGSGFTDEFHKMITVQSGRPDVTVQDLQLITPNQIHGLLVSNANTKTDFSFPTVSINDKVVFQAPDPFAVIRPGEVLNLMFTDMADSGREGKFRVFTNLNEEMFQNFQITPSTPTIKVINPTPLYPFVVDGTILIGPALTGEYGIEITMNNKSLWKRDNIIRIVQPNVGQTGLVQRLQVEDGFYRPGDTARFMVQGSGFQTKDPASLSLDVESIDGEIATFSYIAPGRLGLEILLPKTSTEGVHSVSIKNGDQVVLNVGQAFSIVPENWLRGFRPEPSLMVGAKSQLVLLGRSLSKEFVSKIQSEVDDAGLIVGPFEWVDETKAMASIEAKPEVTPGDYQVRLFVSGEPVVPQFGNIVNIKPKK